MKCKRKQPMLVMSLLAVLLAATACGKPNSSIESSTMDTVTTISVSATTLGTGEQQVEQENSQIEFPYELQDGKLIVNSLFQSSIDNPDCNNEMGEDIASLEITNQSDEFCASAEITITMSDGTEISFTATDIPAGKKIWVFASDNKRVDLNDSCEKIESSAKFKEVSMLEEQLSVSVDDTSITIQNLTENEITNLSVCCHCLFDDVYFGGLTYIYPLTVISAGGSVTIEADDCYMGVAEVVCIIPNNDIQNSQ